MDLAMLDEFGTDKPYNSPGYCTAYPTVMDVRKLEYDGVRSRGSLRKVKALWKKAGKGKENWSKFSKPSPEEQKEKPLV